MSESWCILTTRCGGDIRNPSEAELKRAVEEVGGAGAASDPEHGDTFVRYGDDAGRMYVLTYRASGNLRFEQWADPDFETELAPAGETAGVAPAEAQRLMLELGRGDVERVRRHPWKSAD